MDGFSGRLKSGILTAVMGASGAGKSTLFDVLLGRIENSSKTYGEVLYNGKERTEHDWIHKVSYLKQDDTYFPKFSIQESIMYNLNLYQPFMSKKEKLDFSDEILKRANIYDKRLAYIESLSGGERKRAMIALSMCSDPDVIFMDEPTSGLDSHSALVLINFMKKFAAEKNKIVVVSLHQPGEALFNLFDEIIYLGKGGLFYDGKICDISSWLEEKGMPKPEGISLAEYLFELHSDTPFPPEIAKNKPIVDQIINENRAKYENIRNLNLLRKGLTSLYFELSFSFMAVMVLIKRFYLNYFRSNSIILGTIFKAIGLFIVLVVNHMIFFRKINESMVLHSYDCSNFNEAAKNVKGFFTSEMRRHLSFFFFRFGRGIQFLYSAFVFNFFDNRTILVEDVYSGKYSVLTYYIAYLLHDCVIATYIFAISFGITFFTYAKSLINYCYYLYYAPLIFFCAVNYMFMRLLTTRPGSTSNITSYLILFVSCLGSYECVDFFYDLISGMLSLPESCKYIKCIFLIFPQFLLSALFSYKNLEHVKNSNIPEIELYNYIPNPSETISIEDRSNPKLFFKFVCLEKVSYNVFLGVFVFSAIVNIFGGLYLFNRQVRANLRLKLN